MKKISAVIYAVLLFAVLIFTPFVAVKKTRNSEEFPIKTEEPKTILSLWEIDTFEGGFGSRADYLSKLSEKFIGEGVFVMVSSYTVDGARQKMKEGVLPDLVSFGVGAGYIAEYANKLKDITFKGGEISGGVYAYPWCRGGYFLISKNSVKEPIDRLIVSKGEYSSPLLSLKYSAVKFKTVEVLSPMSAYTEYLKGDAVLLGTQRDIRRLTVRNTAFTVKPLEEFSDLFQYLAITCQDKEKFSYAEEVAEYIYINAEKNLAKIGMLPIGDNLYDGELGSYNTSLTKFTLSPFTSDEIIYDLNNLLEDKINDEDIDGAVNNAVKHL